MNISESMSSIFEQLHQFFKSETVVGDPIKINESVAIIPIISVTFGAGNAVGGKKDNEGNDDEAGGAGAGGKISPVAVVVVKNDEVTVLPLSGRNHYDRIIDMVPDLITKFTNKKE